MPAKALLPKPLGENGRSRRRNMIGELMVLDGLISSRQLHHAMVMQACKRGHLVDHLIALGYVSAQAFIRFLSRQRDGYDIVLSERAARDRLTDLIPRAFAEERQVFPIDRVGLVLIAGMACPLDAGTIRELSDMTGLTVKPRFCSKESIHTAIRRHYRFSIVEGFAAHGPESAELLKLWTGRLAGRTRRWPLPQPIV